DALRLRVELEVDAPARVGIDRQLEADEPLALERGAVADLAIVEVALAIVQLGEPAPEVGELAVGIELVTAREVEAAEILAIEEFRAPVRLQRPAPRLRRPVLERGVDVVQVLAQHEAEIVEVEVLGRDVVFELEEPVLAALLREVEVAARADVAGLD